MPKIHTISIDGDDKITEINTSFIPIVNPEKNSSRGNRNAQVIYTILEKRNKPIDSDFNFNGAEQLYDSEKALKIDNLQQEWYYWHLRLKHCPTTRMQWLIKNGILPKKLGNLI
jgi:hypothetical protein